MTELVRKHFPLTPKGIIEHLKLAPSHLPQDCRVRPFRPDRRQFSWEADRQSGSAAGPKFPSQRPLTSLHLGRTLPDELW